MGSLTVSDISENENLWQIQWYVANLGTVAAVRIYANGQLIHCEFAGGTCQSPVGYLLPGLAQWNWDTRGLLADTYVIRIEGVIPVASGLVARCAGETSFNMCPPAVIPKFPAPAQAGFDLPDDEFFRAQWSLHNLATQPAADLDVDLDLPQAWDIEAGSSDVVVAICDQAIEWHHRDLRNVLLPGFDFAGLTQAYCDALAAGCDPAVPADCLAALPSFADPGGFDPFACLRAGATCSTPDATWQPTTYQPAFLDGNPAYKPLTDGSSLHGSKVASIVGAERNNQWGMAGIAGGSGAASGVRILPLEIWLWEPAGHPGVGVEDSTGNPVAFQGATPTGVTPILSATAGLVASGMDLGLEAGASCLEYLTYLRTELGVNIRVANFSLNGTCPPGSPGCDALIDRFNLAVTAAWDSGIFVVSAATNNSCGSGTGIVTTMALQPRVCSVSDLTMANVLSPTSSCGSSTPGDPCDYEKIAGTEVTLTAPGSSVFAAAGSTSGDPAIVSGAPSDPAAPSMVDSYVSHQCGTSFAAPHVAGVAALLFSYAERPGAILAPQYQNLDPAGVWQILCLTADDMGDTGRYGAGRVNAYRALLELRGQPSLPGDLDGNGVVGSSDAAMLARWLAGAGPASNPSCLMDVNADGTVDSADLDALEDYNNNSGARPDLLVPSTCF